MPRFRRRIGIAGKTGKAASSDIIAGLCDSGLEPFFLGDAFRGAEAPRFHRRAIFNIGGQNGDRWRSL